MTDRQTNKQRGENERERKRVEGRVPEDRDHGHSSVFIPLTPLFFIPDTLAVIHRRLIMIPVSTHHASGRLSVS